MSVGLANGVIIYERDIQKHVRESVRNPGVSE